MRETIWNLTIIIGILLVFIAIGLVIVEFYQAKTFCNTQNSPHSFNFKESQHYCGENKVFRYGEGWDFDRNFSGVRIIP